jgi:MFS family permease
MKWATYFAVSAAVVIVGLSLGVTLPLVSFRLESWGYGPFAIGVMAGMPAVGVLLGARLTGHLAGWFGTPQTLRLCLLASAVSVALLSVMPSYPLWLLLRLLIGISLTVVFVLGESWINQLVEDRLRGRLVALYGTCFALSQLCGPLLLTVLGTDSDRGFWCSAALLVAGSLLLLGRDGAPKVDAQSASGRGLFAFCRSSPAIAWAVVLFAAFEAMVLTLLPVYMLREGFAQQQALIMVSVVVVGDAALQLPLGWLADRVPRQALFRCCGVVLLLSSLSIPLLLHTPLIWGVLVLFGASAGGLYTLSLILVGQRYRDDALVRANAHIALLWGAGCLLGPLSTGAASQWVSGHALPVMMAIGAAGFVWLAFQRGAFSEVARGSGTAANETSTDPSART